MSLFDTIGELCTAPIRVLGEVVNDFSGNGDDEASTPLAILTLGGSSVVKGLAKTIEKANDKLED